MPTLCTVGALGGEMVDMQDSKSRAEELGGSNFMYLPLFLVHFLPLALPNHQSIK